MTKHVEEDKEKIPDFQIRNILEKEKGRLFYDNKHENYVRVKGRSIVCFTVENGKAVVITSYRKDNDHYFKADRFKEIRA